ncbi:MAG: hypothetical protein HOL98_18380 [Gammaproteobacteria bacterium]|jgi:hypothetical protein|nr:hypothetical protein [Gammaproteobacteria bacterium]MBT5205435.1 hypothetical protein [Gammaproteobacteria bacterium]MBT5603336.1 hypothetical protein [Gammaproteobacteria bacterium]MBT6245465.1 hypothetical protein [Gammaproteobacteria bacterium]
MSTWQHIAISLFFIASLAVTPGIAGETTQTLTWSDGTRYVGGIQDGKRHGRGTIYWQDGTRYIGEFRVDLRQGEGLLILPDGTTYRGLFDSDVLLTEDAPEALIGPDALTDPATPAIETNATSAKPAAVDASTERQIKDVLDLWAATWMSQDVIQHLSLYSTNFQPQNSQTIPVWSLNRKERILSPTYIQIDLAYEALTSPNPGIVDVAVKLSYRSNTYREVSNKLIRVQNHQQGWRILKESDR